MSWAPIVETVSPPTPTPDATRRPAHRGPQPLTVLVFIGHPLLELPTRPDPTRGRPRRSNFIRHANGPGVGFARPMQSGRSSGYAVGDDRPDLAVVAIFVTAPDCQSPSVVH